MKKYTIFKVVGKTKTNKLKRRCFNCGYTSEDAYSFKYCPMCGYQILKRLESEKVFITE